MIHKYDKAQKVYYILTIEGEISDYLVLCELPQILLKSCLVNLELAYNQ